MRLFTKTLLFFISVIILQCIITILVITEITEHINHEDAVKELQVESELVYESYNSWKRALWKCINEVKNTDEYRTFLNQSFPYRKQKEFLKLLKNDMVINGIDCFILKERSLPELHITPVTYNSFLLPEIEELENKREHPYIEVLEIGSTLCMAGIVNLSSDQDAPFSNSADLFVLKRMDEKFIEQITLHRHSNAVFVLEKTSSYGSIFKGSSFKNAFSFTSFREEFADIAFDKAYTQLFDQEIEREKLNLTIRKIGKLYPGDDEQNLFLVTAISNLPYIRRVSILNQTVLTVAGFSAIATILLSLFLSRNITNPVQNLLTAMKQLRDGEYKKATYNESNNEIGQLFRGFNDMVTQLHTDKKKMENYIQEITLLKEYNEKILHSIRAGIVIINSNLIIEKANQSFLDFFDLTESAVLGYLVVTVDIEIFNPALIQNIQRILYDEKESHSCIQRLKDNRVFDIKLYPFFSSVEDNSGKQNPSGCIVTSENISKKIELEEKIFQAEKLSSIAMLSAGVAHEINNPLGSIMTNVQNLIVDENDTERRVALKWIEKETHRIAKIVQELLNFSSSKNNQQYGTDVIEVISECISLIQCSLNKDHKIDIRSHVEGDIPPIVMGDDELKQVIINLIKNAIQATPSEGKIDITIQSNPETNQVWIIVEDTGEGIEEDAIPHIFDPFFTTKLNGDGTGLGLSVVYGIINKYKGTVKVESQKHIGTSMKIGVPVRTEISVL